MSQSLLDNEKFNSKNQLKKIQSDLKVMKNRINHLRQQQLKQKQSIQKNKQRAKQILVKKIKLSEMGNYPKINPQEQQQKLQLKRKINQAKKLQHQKQLDNIMKAIYLVKVDDANQIRSTSMNHKRKLQQMKMQSIDLGKQKRLEAYKAEEKRKQRHIHYIKQKMMSVANQKNKDQNQAQAIKIQKKIELQKLQLQQVKLAHNLQKIHSENMLAKKQYYYAKSLPLRNIQSSLQKYDQKDRMITNIDDKTINSQQKSTNLGYSIGNSQLFDKKDIMIKNNQIKVPNTNLDEAKLRIVLQQLKRRQKIKN